MSNSGNILFLC